MINLDTIQDNEIIQLGNQNENDAVTLRFDISAWLEEWPGGAVTISYKRPDDPGVYPVPPTKIAIDGGTLSWKVSQTVTAYPGHGYAVITYTQGDVVCKSPRINTQVSPGLAAAGGAPDPVADWVNEVSAMWGEADVTVTLIEAHEEPSSDVVQDETGTHITLHIPDRGFVLDGPYDPLKVYRLNMVVSSGGGSYGYINPVPAAGIAVTETSHWQQIAEKGDKGDQGIQGVKGDKGDPGDISNIKVDGSTKTKAAGVVDLTSDFARYALWRKTASGNPVSVYPVPESPLYPKVSGTFTQAGTGDPSPSNIRPITPWLASGGQAKVKRTGKNLLDWDFLSRVSNNVGAAVTLADKVFKVVLSGSAYSGMYYHRANALNLALFTSLLGKGVTLSADMKADANVTIQMGIEPTSAQKSVTTSWQRFSVTSSALSASAILYFYNVLTPTATNLYISNIQLELGSVATPYEPYTESEITLTTPQEIPAGWMGCEGNGQVTDGKKVLNGAESGWTMHGTIPGWFSLDPAFTDAYVSNAANDFAKCSHFVQGPHNDVANLIEGKFALGIGVGQRLVFKYTTATTLQNWKDYLAAQYAAGTPVTIYYKLATPITLAPAIASLTALPQLDRVTPRQNVLTASTGNVELTYAKSPIQESNDIATAIAAL